MTWSSETLAQNLNANAIRWGTIYNFRFDSDSPPQTTNAIVGFFKNGSPITIQVQGPGSGGHQFYGQRPNIYIQRNANTFGGGYDQRPVPKCTCSDDQLIRILRFSEYSRRRAVHHLRFVKTLHLQSAERAGQWRPERCQSNG